MLHSLAMSKSQIKIYKKTPGESPSVPSSVYEIILNYPRKNYVTILPHHRDLHHPEPGPF